MKVIFLDVDGVLNCRATFMAQQDKHHVLDEELIARCNALVRETGARIVLSSTWRLLPEARAALKASPLDTSAMIGSTPTGGEVSAHLFSGQQRGDEIASWLSEHPEVERYVIIDDDSDMRPEQLPWFVKTDFASGLTEECSARAKQLLLS